METISHTKADLEKMISDKVEENIHLDYKDARSFLPDGKKNPKTEIAKDISSMANSAGGVIIYGMKEYEEPEMQHLPEKITPISRVDFTKEWLEQVINSNISPKIEGLLVHPIELDKPNEVAYVVEIPQSTTAHQNTADGRYYRRYNFLAQFMSDYEIRDIMNRAKHPMIELDFIIVKDTFEVGDILDNLHMTLNLQKEKKYKTTFTLKIIPKNVGGVFAQYINYFVQLPEDIADLKKAQNLIRPQQGIIEFYGENTFRDIVDAQVNMGGVIRKYGPSRFDPVLPGLRGRSEDLLLAKEPIFDEREITWKVHADNALQRSGKKKLNEIPIVDKPKKVNYI